VSATIRDVAGQAGVSVATVSRVINAKGSVRADTASRVLAVVRQLGYVPHGAARSLTTRRTHTLGVVLPDMHGDFFSELIRGIDLAARVAGFHVLVSGSHSERAEIEAVLQALHGRVDGLVVMAPGVGDPWLHASLPRRTPAVILNDSDEQERHCCICIDNRHGSRLAMEHLLGLGHRRIAMICGPGGNPDAEERRLGYRETLAAVGLCWEPGLELPGDFREESGFRAGLQLAGMSPRPTAVFAANDAMAIGCLAALREQRLQVPDELSLVGFDDVPMARYLAPALTTVHVPIAEVGSGAVELLLDAMDDGDDPRAVRRVVVPTLAIRESTAPIPGAVLRPATRRRRKP
jgi:LacI family transcriptional regulator